MSDSANLGFRAHAERTAGTLLHYWQKKSQKKGYGTLRPDFDYKMKLGAARVYVPFDWEEPQLRTIVVLSLVNQFYQTREADEFLSSIASWDRTLFYKERYEDENDCQYEARQSALIWQMTPYPSNLAVNSFEVQWKLVVAEIRICSLGGHVISSEALSIGELRDSHARKQWSGFIPVGGDDFSVCQGYLVSQRL